MNGKVLITGAAGCVGHELVALLRQRKVALKITDRAGSLLPKSQKNLEVIAVDLTDSTAIADLVKGVDAVVHLAAVVDIGWTLQQLVPINVNATRDLYEAAAAAGVKHFIFFSTGSMYAFKEGFITERDPVAPLNDYGRSKLLAEDFLLSRSGHGPRVNIIRPALIFGPRGKVLLNQMATVPPLLSLAGGRAPRLKGGPATNSVHAFDMANAVVFLLNHPQPHGEIFNVANDDPLEAGEMMDIVFREGGLKPIGPAWPYPKAVVEWLSPLLANGLLMSATNAVIRRLWSAVSTRHHLASGVALKLDREMVDFLAHDVRFSNKKIKKLGFKLRYPKFREGWRDTIRWMHKERWVP